MAVTAASEVGAPGPHTSPDQARAVASRERSLPPASGCARLPCRLVAPGGSLAAASWQASLLTARAPRPWAPPPRRLLPWKPTWQQLPRTQHLPDAALASVTFSCFLSFESDRVLKTACRWGFFAVACQPSSLNWSVWLTSLHAGMAELPPTFLGPLLGP